MNSLFLLFWEQTGQILFMVKEQDWADFPYEIEGGYYYALRSNGELNSTKPLTRYEIDSVTPGNTLLRTQLLKSEGKYDADRNGRFQVLYDDVLKEWYVDERDGWEEA